MKNLFPLFTAVVASCICFAACQKDEVSPLSAGEETNSVENVIMFSSEDLPVLSDTSFLSDFVPMSDVHSSAVGHFSSRNKSIDDDILSDKWRYFQNVPIIDGGYAMVGGNVYQTFIIGDQRWFLEDFKDPGLVASCNNEWERTVFGAAPSPFVSDTAYYFYFDATFLANGLTSTMDFNAPPALNPTTAWKLPNDYDLCHLWCMLDYEQSKVAEIFYEEEHKGVIVAKYNEWGISPQSVYYPDYSFFWIENDNPKVHYTLNGFRKSDGDWAGFNPGYLPPQYLYAPFRLMQYITPIDTIPQD